MRPSATRIWTRRRFLGAAGVAALGTGLAGIPWLRRPTTAVFIAKAEDYDGRLVDTVRRGLASLGVDRAWVAGKSVLLKPNLVEPSLDAPHINTHPTLVRAVAEVFRSWDARQVFVAEGQGHCRDTDLVLEQSHFGPMLAEAGLQFVDLNHDELYVARNSLGQTQLRLLYLPKTLQRADIVVSMPKLKTHHWAGVTLSMKNLFGVMPGISYGWPKNLLHNAGIWQSILDITHAVRPELAIVDGIIGMEGDGPIMGEARRANALIFGTNLVAVDATATRLMGLDPRRIEYLAPAPGLGLGPIAAHAIEQRGESIESLAQRFQLLDHPQMRRFRTAV